MEIGRDGFELFVLITFFEVGEAAFARPWFLCEPLPYPPHLNRIAEVGSASSQELPSRRNINSIPVGLLRNDMNRGLGKPASLRYLAQLQWPAIFDSRQKAAKRWRKPVELVPHADSHAGLVARPGFFVKRESFQLGVPRKERCPKDWNNHAVSPSVGHYLCRQRVVLESTPQRFVLLCNHQ